MPVKGIAEAKSRTAQIVGHIQGELSERTMAEVLIIGAGHAATMTPVDTSLLINSQTRQVTTVFGVTRGQVAYTAAYAAAVNAASGKLKGLPRPGNRGTYWAPGGQPDFLRKGFEDQDAKADIDAAIKRGMTI